MAEGGDPTDETLAHSVQVGDRAARRNVSCAAAGTSILLLLTGVLIGIAVDRTLLAPTEVAATSPLTAEAMSSGLGLPPDRQAELEALLDTLHAEVVASAADGPDALRATTASAHSRIESWLPPESLPAFRQWIQGHREHMMDRMHRGLRPPDPGPPQSH